MNNTEYEMLTKEDLFDMLQDSLRDVVYLEDKIQELNAKLDESDGDYDAGYNDGRFEAEQSKYDDGYEAGYEAAMEEAELHHGL